MEENEINGINNLLPQDEEKAVMSLFGKGLHIYDNSELMNQISDLDSKEEVNEELVVSVNEIIGFINSLK